MLGDTILQEIERDICKWLDELLTKKVKQYDLEDVGIDPDGKSKPFHKALLPKEFLRMSDFERSFSTIMGKSFERQSAIIAKSRFPIVRLQHVTEGELPASVETEISDIVGKINKGHVFTDYLDTVNDIVKMTTQRHDKRVTRSITSDLYLGDKDGNEVFFEIKTPKPNKEQCLNITRKHLWIHAIRKKIFPNVKTYFGMAYNPFGEGNEYRHSFTVRHMDVEHQTLIGEGYWDFLGGRGTYKELLDIYSHVGRLKLDVIQEILKR